MKKIITNNNQIKVSIKVKILIVLGLLFAGSSIFLTIETASVGSENTYLENKQAQVEVSRREIEKSLTQGISISKLQEDSATLGFVKPQSIMYIKGDEPVASLH